MRRTERLFQIIQILRSAREPVTGRMLADELEISLRTLYRDMAELTAQRVPVSGEAGMGYVLDRDYDMPPLMLTVDELEAAALGAAWVAAEADPTLARAARDLVAKLSEAVPDDLRSVILDGSAMPINTKALIKENFDSVTLRRAIRTRQKLQLNYTDRDGQLSARVVWPLVIAFLDRTRYLVAWCETRQAFRHFKTDRIQSLDVLDTPYPGRRAALLKDWRREAAEGER